MGVIWFWILCSLLVTYASSNPVGENSQSLHVWPYIVKRSDGTSTCEDQQVFNWRNDFHECFIDRKYNDGGRYLNYIVDRILDHSEACMETSSKDCRPDFDGFTSLLNKTISQMKDYAYMYLEAIYKGREDIKDLDCVERVLDIETYEDCFRKIASQDPDASEESFQKKVQDGIRCANRENSGCSDDAKTALNKIVRIIFGVEQPTWETFEVEIKPTKAPAPQPNWETFEVEIKPTEAPAPMQWYDYIAYPFVQVYKWISSWFG